MRIVSAVYIPKVYIELYHLYIYKPPHFRLRHNNNQCCPIMIIIHLSCVNGHRGFSSYTLDLIYKCDRACKYLDMYSKLSLSSAVYASYVNRIVCGAVTRRRTFGVRIKFVLCTFCGDAATIG